MTSAGASNGSRSRYRYLAIALCLAIATALVWPRPPDPGEHLAGGAPIRAAETTTGPVLRGAGAEPAAASPEQPSELGTRSADVAVRGRVVSVEGAPLAGAAVRVLAASATPLSDPTVTREPATASPVLTDERGLYAVSPSDGGWLRLLISKPGFSSSAIETRADGGLRTTILVRTAHLAGRVTGPSGRAVEGALVTLQTTHVVGVHGQRECATDEDGRFAFEEVDAEPESGRRERASYLRVQAAGFAMFSTERLVVEPGASKHVDVVLHPGWSLSVLVLDASTQRPVPSAHVALWGSRLRTVESRLGQPPASPWTWEAVALAMADREGRVRLEHLPAASYQEQAGSLSPSESHEWLGQVLACQDGYACAASEQLGYDAVDGSEEEMTLYLVPGVAARGRVLDEMGIPLRDVYVRAVVPDELDRLWAADADAAAQSHVWWGLSDDDGGFLLPSVPVIHDRPFDIVLRARIDGPRDAAYDEVESTVRIDPATRDTLILPDIVMPSAQGPGVTLHVLDASGHAVAGAQVDRLDIPGGRHVTNIDGEARLAWRKVRPPPHELVRVHRRGMGTQVIRVTPTTPPAITDLVLHPGRTISGIVEDEEGHRIARARVEAVWQASDQGPLPEQLVGTHWTRVSWSDTGPDGSFVLEDLPGGTFQVRAQPHAARVPPFVMGQYVRREPNAGDEPTVSAGASGVVVVLRTP